MQRPQNLNIYWKAKLWQSQVFLFSLIKIKKKNAFNKRR